MNESIDPTSGNYKAGQTDSSKTTPSSDYKEVAQNTDGGPYHIVMGMKMNEDQYKKFMKSLSDSVINQIKQDEADYNRTQDEIRLEEHLDEG